MLTAMAYNYSHKNEAVKLFEIGKVFIPTEAGKLPDEQEKLTVGMYGKGMDFFDIKGSVEAVLAGINVTDVTYRAVTDNPTFHPGRTAEILINGEPAGIMGEIHPDAAKNFDIDTDCYVAEIDLLEIFNNINKSVKFKPLPKFPAVERDIALLVDKTVAVGDLEATIVKASGKLLDSIKLFDVYEGDRIPEGKKSVAFAISFRDPERSLTNEEINKVFKKITKDLEFKNKAQLR